MQRKVEERRLAYYKQAASAEYWDEVWAKNVTSELYDQARQGELGYYEKVFPQYLPKDGRIIEAGCGLGQFIMALRQLGYDVEGVEWGGETVELVKSILPDLPIRQGDVTELEVPDEYYAGYISLGVVEHLQEGPGVFLKEAHRILSEQGMAFISVPHFHTLRRLKAFLGIYNDPVDGLAFYQYAYRPDHFIEILKHYGFEVVESMPYDGYKGTKDEINWLVKLFEIPRIGWRIRRFFERSKWLERHFGHMTLFVCRKA